MEKIELRSEKVRNLIGTVPPTLVRFGSICLIALLTILVAVAYFVKIPNVMDCNIVIEEKDDSTKFIVTSCSKIVHKIISKGTPVYVYKNNDLLFTGFLSCDLENVYLSRNNFEVNLQIEVPENILINNQIRLDLKNGATLSAKIKLDNQSILKNVFNMFYVQKG